MRRRSRTALRPLPPCTAEKKHVGFSGTGRTLVAGTKPDGPGGAGPVGWMDSCVLIRTACENVFRDRARTFLLMYDGVHPGGGGRTSVGGAVNGLFEIWQEDTLLST